MDDVNVPSSAHITETDAPEQRVYNVKPENIPSNEVLSENNKDLATPSVDLNNLNPDDDDPEKSQMR